MVRSETLKTNSGTSKRINLDSAASEHVVNDRSLLNNSKKIEPLGTEVADGRIVEAHEKGEITVQMNDRTTGKINSLVLKNVYYIKDIELNLMSVSRLDEQEISSQFSKGIVKLLDRRSNEETLGAGVRRDDGLFEFQILNTDRNRGAYSLKSQEYGIKL